MLGKASEIKEALEKFDELPENRPLNDHDEYILENSIEWLRYLLQENQRYKEALEWYEDAGCVDFEFDMGEIARQALKEGDTE